MEGSGDDGDVEKAASLLSIVIVSVVRDMQLDFRQRDCSSADWAGGTGCNPLLFPRQCQDTPLGLYPALASTSSLSKIILGPDNSVVGVLLLGVPSAVPRLEQACVMQGVVDVRHAVGWV